MTIQNGRIYGRFSSKPQERGDSKRRQIEGAKAYAAKNGITIVAEPYFDEGVSGKAGLNLEKEFGHLLKDAQEGEAVLCEALDRIGRQNPFIIGKLVYDLVAKGLTVIAWQEGKVINKDNIDTLETQFSVFTGAAVGHADNTRKMKRLKETTTNAFKLGEQGVQSGTLVKYLPQCFTWNEDKKAIELDCVKAATIKRIFTMFNDNIGKTTICQTLNKENVPTLYHHGQQTIGTKKPWMETSIKKILCNESYVGVLHVKGHRITCIPKVVSSETFDKAQLLMQRYSKRAGKTNGRVNNLFNGLSVCKHCGGTVNVSVSPPKKAGNKVCYSYRCKNARLKQCEHHKMLNAATVEYLFCYYFFMGDPEQSLSTNTSELAAKITATQAKIIKLKTAITNLYDMAEFGDAEAKDRIAKRKSEMLEAEQKLIQLKGQTIERANFPAVVATVKKMILDGVATEVWDMKELPAKLANNEIRAKLRANLPSIFEKVVFDTTARTVEGILKEGVKLNTFFRDITKFQIPRSPHGR
jgi:DNA invertase Pin-like site-specific DNA recombinase